MEELEKFSAEITVYIDQINAINSQHNQENDTILGKLDNNIQEHQQAKAEIKETLQHIKNCIDITIQNEEEMHQQTESLLTSDKKILDILLPTAKQVEQAQNSITNLFKYGHLT
jgi:hypothetical protein